MISVYTEKCECCGVEMSDLSGAVYMRFSDGVKWFCCEDHKGQWSREKSKKTAERKNRQADRAKARPYYGKKRRMPGFESLVVSSMIEGE